MRSWALGGSSEGAAAVAAPSPPGAASTSARPAAGTTTGSSRASGSGSAAASLLSVPPKGDTPATGIYGMPEGAFQIRDLDSGREYALDKRFWIKDMDSGTVYVVEGGEAGGKGGKGDAATARSKSGPEPERVRELLSGRELSLNEFEKTLGYAPGSVGRSGSGGGSGSGRPGSGQPTSNGGGSSSPRPKSWLGSVLHLMGPHSTDDASAAAVAASKELAPAPAAAQPGARVRLQTHRRGLGSLEALTLGQRLDAHVGVVWAMSFSRNGKYLASAGQDAVVRVWEVQERGVPAGAGGTAGSGPSGSTVPSAASPAPPAPAVAGVPPSLLATTPLRSWAGHKADVLDLSWSGTHFLLSGSMDKTVRLWHASMDDCLRVFKHTDFVTAVCFHPRDDRLFVSGSIDGKLRLWNIPDQRVTSWHDVHDMVTAAGIAPDGRRVAVGTMKGKCRLYALHGSSLEYDAQIDVRNARGAHSRGKKITGVAYAPGHANRLLVTSNDSRIRLYDNLSLRVKLKGHGNKSTQIRASFSPDARRVICGSDDGWVYLWDLPLPPSKNSKAADDAPPEKVVAYEAFQASADVTTVAMFAPARCAGAAQDHDIMLAAGYGGEIRTYEAPSS